ncbi:MAG: hypothetical protein GVY19_00405 [Bacteroidetes bacterium]|jgi:hypothetical protein|nr:hypothetical protein [Bacteroidota bacterium]
MTNVSYQINISPFDIEMTRHLLEHQVNFFKDQVAEVLITYNLSEELLSDPGYKEKHERTMKLIDSLTDDKVRYITVDYSEKMINEVFDYFYKNLKNRPLFDCKGTPIYAFIYGFYQCKYDLVFHIDGDMFFAGTSKVWMKEAVELLESDPKLLTVSPHPGPPHPDGILLEQRYSKTDKPYVFEFDHMGTRVCLFDRRDLHQKLFYQLPTLKNIVYAKVFKKPMMDLMERIISKYMRMNGLKRIDFLGSDGGVYTLHPLYRSQEFFDNIPRIIEDMQNNNIAEEQRGRYNMYTFIDWTEAKENFMQAKSLKRKLLGIK